MSERADKAYEVVAWVLFVGILADYLTPSVSDWYWTRKMKHAEVPDE